MTYYTFLLLYRMCEKIITSCQWQENDSVRQCYANQGSHDQYSGFYFQRTAGWLVASERHSKHDIHLVHSSSGLLPLHQSRELFSAQEVSRLRYPADCQHAECITQPKWILNKEYTGPFRSNHIVFLPPASFKCICDPKSLPQAASFSCCHGSTEAYSCMRI